MLEDLLEDVVLEGRTAQRTDGCAGAGGRHPMRGKPERHDPALGRGVELLHEVGVGCLPGDRFEQLGDFGRGQAELFGRDVQRVLMQHPAQLVVLRAIPRHQHQRGPGRHQLGEIPDGFPSCSCGQDVAVVQDDDGPPRSQRQIPDEEGEHRIGQRRPALQRLVRLPAQFRARSTGTLQQMGPQPDRVLVALVEAEPGHDTGRRLRPGPIGGQGALAGAGRTGDEDSVGEILGRQPGEQRRPLDVGRGALGEAQFGLHDERRRPRRARRRAGLVSGGYLAAGHKPTRGVDTSAV